MEGTEAEFRRKTKKLATDRNGRLQLLRFHPKLAEAE
jgi:hypothetical protein